MKQGTCLVAVGSILDPSSVLFESGGLWLLRDNDDWGQISPASQKTEKAWS